MIISELLENQQNLAKFLVLFLFLMVLHYQLINSQKIEVKTTKENILKLRENIVSLRNIVEKNHDSLHNQITDKKLSLTNYELSQIADLEVIANDLLNFSLKYSEYYDDFIFFIKSKKAGTIEISYKSKFLPSKNFLVFLINYHKLLQLQDVKISNNNTKISLRAIYENV